VSGTGALCPLPLRLGVVDSSGLAADDHARLAADLLAATRSCLVWRVTVTATSDSTGTVDAYSGVNGNAITDAPTIEFVKVGSYVEVRINAEFAHDDEFGNRRIVDAHLVTFHQAGPVASQYMGSKEWQYDGVRKFLVGNVQPGTSVTICGYGRWDAFGGTISAYGGATDKRDSRTERTPYAWTALQMLRDARGSAYSREVGNLVHAENLAISRAHAGSWRTAERLQTNANPETAYEKAEEWRETLGVRPRVDDTPTTLRQRNGAKFRAAVGPTAAQVDEAISKLLGPIYVQSWREYGTLGNPPSETYWPGVNPGSSDYDLGGGAWYSERAFLMVEVVDPSAATLVEFDEKMDELTELLDRMLPASSTFDWATNVAGGFILDEDLLDVDAIS
jgi:hypothetical protein